MSAVIAVAVYALGCVVMALIVCHSFAKSGPLDYGDIGGALFFGLGWPVLAPFMVVVWAASKVLPLLGIEVER